MKRSAEYVLRRAAGGTSHFARVVVEAKTSEGEWRVRELREGMPEVYESRRWRLAALEGASLVAKRLEPIYPAQELTVTRVHGVLSDTREDTVWCTAIIATYRAVAGSGEEPRPMFSDGRWGVAFPDGEQLRYGEPLER